MKLSKAAQKRIKILSLAFALLLGSVVFLLAGPQTLDLVESKVSSSNLAPAILDQGTVLAEKTQPKIEIVSSNTQPPLITAVAAVAYDANFDKILYQKNIDARLAPASTTKIMTAIISSEHFNSGDLLTVPSAAIVGGSTMGLTPGEQLTYRSLLYGMMLNSGNDAAYTIAYNYPGGIDVFIEKMNQKALAIGAKNTNFTNPAGFDNPNHYSSAYDLLLISKEALRNAKLGTVYSTKETFVTSVDKIHQHSLKNLNKMLNIDGVIGIKTGTTEMAGESLVGLVERNNQTIITVMLNSQDRFGETKTLLDWIFTNYSWKVN